MRRIRSVVIKDFGKRRVWGEADQRSGTVYISDKCKGLKHLEISIHEGGHIVCPYLTEEEIVAMSMDIALMLWEMGYRMPDNDRSIPLQDE